MSPQELSFAIEALLFAHARPLSVAEMRRLLRRGQPAELGEQDDDKQADEAMMQAAAQEHLASETAVPPPYNAVVSGAAEPARLAHDHTQAEAAAVAQFAAQPEPNEEAVGTPESASDGQQAGDSAGKAVLEDVLAADVQNNEPEQHDKAFVLTSQDNAPKAPSSLAATLREAIAMLQLRWRDVDQERGVQLIEVAGGLTFRTNPRYAETVRLLREDKPQRLTRPALEALAIIAYRQPVTKPDIDHLRGVDSGGVVKVLLERSLIAILGKREEPGRPLMYGTTDHFLSFFSLSSLSDLPSLRQFDELNDEAAEALRALSGLPSLQSLSEGAKQFRLDDVSGAEGLDDVVANLDERENRARAAFLEHGVVLGGAEGEDSAGPAFGTAPASQLTQH